MSREVIVPPPDPPVIVEDDKHTVKAPISDREVLCTALVYLSKKVHEALEVDRQINKRYARNLYLINQKYSNSKKFIREQFKVDLPIEVSAWNDVEQEFLKVRLLITVVDFEPSYLWYKLSIEFDQFISDKTKFLMDKMDEEDEMVCQTPTRITDSSRENDTSTPVGNSSRLSTSSINSTPDVNLSELRQRKNIQISTPVVNPRINHHKEITIGSPRFEDALQNRSPVTKPKSPQVGTSLDDDDDDISVVFESVPKKGIKSSK